MTVDNNNEGLVGRRRSEPESGFTTMAGDLLQGWTPKLELSTNNGDVDTSSQDEILAVADLKLLLSDFLELYKNLRADKLAEAFKDGICKNDAPELGHIHNYYEPYAKPKKLAAELSKLICGMPAFTNMNIGPLKSFPGVRGSQASEEQILQEVKPMVNAINKALAAAQLQQAGGTTLFTNFQNLHKSLDIPLPSMFYFREQIEYFRRKINMFHITDPQLVQRIVNLEERLEDLILAKNFFGKNGPMVVIPTVSLRDKTVGRFEYPISDKLDLLENQLEYFNGILHSKLQHQHREKISGLQESTNIAMQETLSSEIYEQEHQALQQTFDNPPQSERHIRTEQKFTALSGMLINVTTDITSLQGQDESGGTIMDMRRHAEIAAGRLFETRLAVENFLKEVEGHRSSWHEITASSKASGLIKKATGLLQKLKERLVEIEKQSTPIALDWDEIRLSANRASMPISDFEQMTTNMVDLITNLEADRMRLQQDMEDAEATLEENENDLQSISASLEQLEKILAELSGKRCTILDVYDAIRLTVTLPPLETRNSTLPSAPLQ